MESSTLGSPRQSARWALLVALALLLAGDAVSGRVALLPASDPLVVSLLLLCAGGVLSGLLAGMLGIGGALVTIPVLHFTLPALGINAALVPATAVASALMAMVPITLVAAWRRIVTARSRTAGCAEWRCRWRSVRHAGRCSRRR